MKFSELAENLGLGEDEFLEMVELFLDTSASDLSKLQAALDQENAQGVVEAAHSIKGASITMGFVEAHEAAKEIEENARNDNLETIADYLQVLKKKLDEIAEVAQR